jgi:hypothetical protein
MKTDFCGDGAGTLCDREPVRGRSAAMISAGGSPKASVAVDTGVFLMQLQRDRVVFAAETRGTTIGRGPLRSRGCSADCDQGTVEAV